MTLDTRRQKVVIEFHANTGWMTMFDNGAVEVFRSPERALRAVRRQSAKGNIDATLTTIEWRNTPPGFVPPK